jgi:hypothetical protein
VPLLDAADLAGEALREAFFPAFPDLRRSVSFFVLPGIWHLLIRMNAGFREEGWLGRILHGLKDKSEFISGRRKLSIAKGHSQINFELNLLPPICDCFSFPSRIKMFPKSVEKASER